MELLATGSVEFQPIPPPAAMARPAAPHAVGNSISVWEKLMTMRTVAIANSAAKASFSATVVPPLLTRYTP